MDFYILIFRHKQGKAPGCFGKGRGLSTRVELEETQKLFHKYHTFDLPEFPGLKMNEINA